MKKNIVKIISIVLIAFLAIGGITFSPNIAKAENEEYVRYRLNAWVYVEEEQDLYEYDSVGDDSYDSGASLFLINYRDSLEKVEAEVKWHKYTGITDYTKLLVDSNKEFYYRTNGELETAHGCEPNEFDKDGLGDFVPLDEASLKNSIKMLENVDLNSMTDEEVAQFILEVSNDPEGRFYGKPTKKYIDSFRRSYNSDLDKLKNAYNLLKDAYFIRSTKTSIHPRDARDESYSPTYPMLVFYHPEKPTEAYGLVYTTSYSESMRGDFEFGFNIVPLNKSVKEIIEEDSELTISEEQITSSKDEQSTKIVKISNDDNPTDINATPVTIFKAGHNGISYVPVKLFVTAKDTIIGFHYSDQTEQLTSPKTLEGINRPYAFPGTSQGVLSEIPAFRFDYEPVSSEGKITVSKQVIGNEVDKEREFKFTLYLKGKLPDGSWVTPCEYNNVKFEGHEGWIEGSFYLKDGESKTFDIPAGVEYSLYEETMGYGEDGSYFTKPTTGTVQAGKEDSIVVTNTRNEESVGFKLKKFFADGEEKPVEFEIELEDKSINGNYDGLNFANGVANITVEPDRDATISGLPAGTKYTIKEVNSEEYESSFKYITPVDLQDGQVYHDIQDGGQLVGSEEYYDKMANLIQDNDGYTKGSYTGEMESWSDRFYMNPYMESVLICKNTKKETPRFPLTLTKKVSGNAGDKDKKFNFTIYLNDTKETNISGIEFKKEGDYYVGNVELKDNESVSLDLPKDTVYAIKEDSDGYEVETVAEEYTEDTNLPEANIYGKMSAEKNVTFVNILDKFGNLTVSKALAGNDIDTTKSFDFDIEVSDNLTGTYGDVEIKDGKGTFSLKSGQVANIKDLPYGTTYKVTEKDYSSEGYVSSSDMSEGKIGDDVADNLNFTNTRDTFGKLKVKKTVSGNTIEDKTFNVQIKIDSVNATYSGVEFKNGIGNIQLKANEEKVIEGIPNGATYSIEEIEADDYNASYKNRSGKITGNNETIAEINNHKDTFGAIDISKKATGNAVNPDEVYKFEVTAEGLKDGVYSGVQFKDGKATVEIKADEHKTIGSIPNNTKYSVKELGDYEVSYKNETGTVTGNTVQNVEVSNKIDTFGNLSIAKTVSGNTIEDKVFKFDITLGKENATYSGVEFKNGKATIELKANEKKVLEGIPNNTPYSITEVGADDYEVSSEHTLGNIKGNETIYAVINNKKDTFGNLSIKKTVSGNTIEDRTFKFKVTLSDKSYSKDGFKDGVVQVELKADEEKVFKDIPNGTQYVVEELETDGYEVTSSLEKGTIKGGETAYTIVNNHKDTFGSLLVKKTVGGNDIDENAVYKFKVTFENGESSTIELKANEEKLFENLPNGTIYTVEELDAEGYTVTSTGETGTIKGNTTAEAIFNNYRDSFGAIKVKKTVSGNTIDENAEYRFKIETTTLEGTYSDVEFKDGIATFNLKANEEKVIEGLPNNTQYIITEEDADADVTYTAEGVNVAAYDENVMGIVRGGGTDEIVVNNHKDTFGNLAIKKTVSGEGIDENAVYKFIVKAGDLTGTYSEVEFANGEAVVEVKANEEKVIEGLPNNTEYTVTETSTEGFEVTYENETGTVKGNETCSAVINNHKDPTIIPDEPKKDETLEIYQPAKEPEMDVTMEKTVVDIDAPETGDVKNVVPYIFMAIAAGIGITAVIANKKRKHN